MIGKNGAHKELVFGSFIAVERGFELKVAVKIADTPERGLFFRATLPIDLDAPGLIKVVGITEDRFVLNACMSCADYHFMMLGVVTLFDERLGIDITVRTPLRKTDRQQTARFREQADLVCRNRVFWIEA